MFEIKVKPVIVEPSLPVERVIVPLDNTLVEFMLVMVNGVVIIKFLPLTLPIFIVSPEFIPEVFLIFPDSSK